MWKAWGRVETHAGRGGSTRRDSPQWRLEPKEARRVSTARGWTSAVSEPEAEEGIHVKGHPGVGLLSFSCSVVPDTQTAARWAPLSFTVFRNLLMDWDTRAQQD